VLWTCLVVGIAASLAVAGVLVHKLRYGSGFDEDLGKKKWLVGVRKSFFTDYTTDAQDFLAGPEELARRGFRTDPPETIAAWARDALPRIPYLRDLEAAPLPDAPIERTQALVLRFSKNGGIGCGHFRNLLDNLEHIADGEGQGCCSDHAQAMIALGQAFGLSVRQVGIGDHSFNEVWDPARGKWAFVDPQFALMARDEDGAPLGLFEIRERFRTGRAVRYEFFGNQHHVFSRQDPARHPYFASFDSFRDVRVVWGSNVIEQDRLEARHGALPKAARQLVGYATGVFPPMRVYADEHALLPAQLERARRTTLGIAAFLVVSTVVPAVALLATRPPRARRDALRGAYSSSGR
jgi:hypothetical protein